MQKIVLAKYNIIEVDKVNRTAPIFAKENATFIGMVIEEEGKGWILKLGGRYAANGHHRTLQECLESCSKYGYEFFVN